MRAFIGGAIREARRGIVQTGGAQRRFTRVIARIGGNNRTVATFVQPLTLSAPNAEGTSNSNSYTGATSTATPSGGLGPYSYQWTVTSGPIFVSGASLATGTFYAAVPYNTVKSGTATVVCTDALGSTATASITITLISERFTGDN